MFEYVLLREKCDHSPVIINSDSDCGLAEKGSMCPCRRCGVLITWSYNKGNYQSVDIAYGV